VLSDLRRAGVTILERGWLSSNSVVLHGIEERGAVVVDTGYWSHAEQTVSLLKHELGSEPLAKVINTHLHSDHCGGNLAICSQFGSGIHVPAGSAELVDTWDVDRLTYAATGQHCPRFRRSGSISSGERIDAGCWQWDVIAAPGHDPLSVALYQPELKTLISADALWENGFGVVFPELEGLDAFDEVGSTLDCFAGLDVSLVVPGHGRPFTDFQGALVRARSRLDRFLRFPSEHAAYAAKVLIKFRLLETQVESLGSLENWLVGARYFELVRQRHFPDQEASDWVQSLLKDMESRKAIRLASGKIYDA